jgi:hypothetical protein
MANRVMFHVVQHCGAPRFSAACLFTALMLVVGAPFVSARTNGCGGDNGGITLPSGFCATIFADNLGHAQAATRCGWRWRYPQSPTTDST